MTVAEFAALPDEDGVKRELIDGEVFEMASGGPVHERVKSNITRLLWRFVEAHQIKALVQSETRYHLPEIVCQPDVSLVLGESLDPSKSGKITIAPDLAFEVVSSETAEQLHHKVKALLASGTSAVVAIYASDREIVVQRAGRRMEWVESGGLLSLDDILPGFAIPAASVFEGI